MRGDVVIFRSGSLEQIAYMLTHVGFETGVDDREHAVADDGPDLLLLVQGVRFARIC